MKENEVVVVHMASPEDIIFLSQNLRERDNCGTGNKDVCQYGTVAGCVNSSEHLGSINCREFC
jgi:hypothetical protein